MNRYAYTYLYGGPSIPICLYSTQSCAYPCRFSLSISAFSEWHSRSQVCSICLHSSILLCIICRLCSKHSTHIKRLHLQTHVQCSVNTVDVCTYVHIFSIPMHTCIYVCTYVHTLHRHSIVTSMPSASLHCSTWPRKALPQGSTVPWILDNSQQCCSTA